MTRTLASAPGKVVVAGEYAVLNGAPAIAMAVDRRAQVTVTPLAGGHHSFAAPGFTDGTFRFRQRSGGIEWLDTLPQTGGFELFECVLEEAAPAPSEALAYRIDSRAFHDSDSGRKLGLGSSAAVAVALAGACSVEGAAAVAGIAATAHARFQGGHGSGIDIACAAHGGLIRYVRDGAVESVTWPDGVHARVLWSGQTASTAGKLADLERRASRSSARALEAAADKAARVWSSGDPSAVLNALRQFADSLRVYDAEHGAGIFTGGHETLAALSAGHSALTYKPCGAGGGDVGMAFSADPDELDAFAARAEELGFKRLQIDVDTTGLHRLEEAA